MKNTALLLLITFSTFAQIKHPETDFVINENKLIWQHIYETSDKNPEDLINYFEKEVVRNFNQSKFQVIDNTISFEINNDQVNYKKYGGTTMGTVLFATMNMNYLVVIDLKDKKYRVTISDIFLDNNSFGIGHSSGNLSEYCTKKSGAAFQSNNLVTKGLNYQHQHFLERFTIKTQSTAENQW